MRKERKTKSSERYNKILTLAQNISSYGKSGYKDPVLDQNVIHPNWLKKKENFKIRVYKTQVGESQGLAITLV